ncbi:MAG: ABC transporter substrate-binding protein [Propionibacteriaceae bacterium]|nr:ABC transporter substrate-binding protein [Propionibacteriaceae bacterium]
MMSAPRSPEDGPRRSWRLPLIALAAVLVLIAAVAVVGRLTGPTELAVRSCRPGGPLLPPAILDPCGLPVTDATTARITRFDPITDRLEPDLAEAITTADNRNFTIRLVADRRFSDGTAVTAAHVARAWNNLADCRRGYPAALLLATIDGFEDSAQPCTDEPPPLAGVTVVDERTLTVRTAEPDPELPARLAHPATAPLPDLFYDEPEQFRDLPVGAGPFVVTQNHDHEIVLERSPSYTGPFPAAVDSIRLPVYIDGQEAFNDIRRGPLDLTEVVPADRLIDGRAREGADGRFSVGASAVFLQAMRVNDPQLTDPRKRRALSMAADRALLAERMFDGTRHPARGWSLTELRSGDCGDTCTFDPQAARALWDEAGGYRGTLWVWGTRAEAERAQLHALCNEWSLTLGVDCAVQTMSDHKELQDRGVEGLILTALPRQLPGLDGELAMFLPLLRSPDTDPAIADALAERDTAALTIALTTSWSLLPLWFDNAPQLSAPGVAEIHRTPMGTIDLTKVTDR